MSVTETVIVESQKSPILSQPKTIRFPAKQQEDTKKEQRKHTTDSIHCRWDNCHAHFDTSGALLEHLQVGDDNMYAHMDHLQGDRTVDDRNVVRGIGVEEFLGHWSAKRVLCRE